MHAADLPVTERSTDSPWIGTIAVEVHAPPPIGPLVVVHHKPNWQYGRELERELQAVVAARLAEWVAGDRGVHVVLLGDFDASPDSGSVRFWTGRQSLDGARWHAP